MRLGVGLLQITLQQFIDDNLVFMEPMLENVLTLKVVFKCYKFVLGLRVNFYKSRLVGIVV